MIFIGNGPSRTIPTIINQNYNIGHLCSISDEKPKHEFDDYFFFRDCVFGHNCNEKNLTQWSMSVDLIESLSNLESLYMQMMERFESWSGLITYERRINLYHKILKFWYNYLLKNNINVCVFMTIPHFGYDYIIYNLCKLIGIKTIMIHRIPVVKNSDPHIYIFDSLEHHIRDLKKRFEFYLGNESKVKLNSHFVAHLSLQNNSDKTFTGITIRQGYFRRVKYKFSSIIKRAQGLKRLRPYMTWHDLFTRGIQIFRTNGLKNKYVSNPDLNKKFVFFPLHKQPEASTSPMGDIFVFQDFVVDLLLEGLPEDVFIYVKPHVAKGKNYKFYNRIILHPRVVILDKNVSAFKLMQQSLAVATITGTVGWEAFMNDKPVLMFGNYFYQDAPMVHNVRSAGDIIKGLEIFDKNDMLKVEKTKIKKAFLMALQESTFRGWVDNRYAAKSTMSAIENLKMIASEINNHLEKQSQFCKSESKFE